MQTIEERLAALERQARFWRFSTLLLVLCSMAIASLPRARAADDALDAEVLRVSRLEIVDPQGRKRAEFGMKPGKHPFLEPQLLLYYSDGEDNFAARLAMLAGEPGLAFSDTHSHIASAYYVSGDGSASLVMSEHGSDRLVLAGGGVGPRLVLFDDPFKKSNEARAELSIRQAGPALKLFDAKGQFKAGLAVPVTTSTPRKAKRD